MKLKEYNFLKEKNEYFQSGDSVIDTQDDFDFVFSKLKDFRNDGFVFRGINEAKYKIFNSGQRKFLTNCFYNNSSYKDFIIHEINRFKKEEYQIFNSLIVNSGINANNYLALLSLMQHYGYPTPCIDFSCNPLIALYFAFYNCSDNNNGGIENYVSLYFMSKNHLPIHFFDLSPAFIEALNMRNLLKREKNILSLDNEIPFNTLFEMNESIYIEITLKDSIDYKTFNNDNIIKQEGILLLTDNAYLPFEEIQRNIFKAHNSTNWLGIKCFNFNKKLKKYVLKFLNSSRVNNNALFS